MKNGRSQVTKAPQRERDYRVMADGFLARAEPAVAWSCPVCADEGFRWVETERGATALAPCECAQIHLRHELFNSAGIPARFAGCQLDTFRIDTGGAQLGAVLLAVSGFVNAYPAETRGVLLHGSVGVGKTHLVVGAIRKLTLEKGIPCRFADFSHLLGELKLAYDQGRGAQKLIDELARIEILVIDELGKGRQSDWEQSILDELITRRYNQGRTCLITTNFRVQPRQGAPDSGRGRPNLAREEMYSLEQVVGLRVFSRLHEMCSFIPIDGPDQRRLRRG